MNVFSYILVISDGPKVNALSGHETGPEMAPEEGWVGVEEVAAHLRLAKQSVYWWIESKGFPAHRVGRLFRFKLSEVDKWIKSGGGDSRSDSPATTSASQAGISRWRKKRTRKNENE